MPPPFARPELLATPDWLAENLSRPGIRIVDCRWRVDGTARQRYNVAHIPGAVFLDVEAIAAAGLKNVEFSRTIFSR